MAGMAEVGRLFNNNELIVAEVLQSAEAMKAAVTHLEQFMEKAESATRGKIVLATVKGDVHDIGKNLVEIILSNNGYQVINLGIKVPPEELIRAFHEHAPDAIGLSGLLVKSAQQMVITAGDLQDAGIERAAAGGRRGAFGQFTRTRSRRAMAGRLYAKDAMTGLRLMNRLMDPPAREKLVEVTSNGGAAQPAPSARSRTRPQAKRAAAQCAPIFRFRPRRISIAKCATCRISPKSGAISIPTCSTAAIWASKVTSRSPARARSARRWSCFIRRRK